MVGDGAIFDLRGSFPNRNGVDDLTFVVSGITRVPRATNSPLKACRFNRSMQHHVS
jgi:hypothetical protein